MEKTNSAFLTILKNALILFLITFISGIMLSSVYNITKDRIAEQEELAKLEAYNTVFPGYSALLSTDELKTAIADSQAILLLSSTDFRNVIINEAFAVGDENGVIIGHVVSVTSKDGFGGELTLALGVKNDGTVTGVEITENNETAGLGAKASDKKFKAQFANKNVESFVVTKTGKSAENEIDAITAATITSRAATDAVNAGLFFVNHCVSANNQ